MKTLVIDLAFDQAVSVIEDNKELALLQNKNQKTSDTFMQLLDTCLTEAKLSINDIDIIAVNLGPGSFTGLRVAASIAKGLGVDGQIKYNTFTSFDYLKGEKQNVVVPGFSSFIYLKNMVGEMSCEEITNLEKAQKYITFDANLAEKLTNLGFKVQLLEKCSYVEILKNNNNLLKINELEPIYLRKSQAELMREKKLK